MGDILALILVFLFIAAFAIGSWIWLSYADDDDDGGDDKNGSN